MSSSSAKTRRRKLLSLLRILETMMIVIKMTAMTRKMKVVKVVMTTKATPRATMMIKMNHLKVRVIAKMSKSRSKLAWTMLAQKKMTNLQPSLPKNQ